MNSVKRRAKKFLIFTLQNLKKLLKRQISLLKIISHLKNIMKRYLNPKFFDKNNV